jgi:hypothetical protein
MQDKAPSTQMDSLPSPFGLPWMVQMTGAAFQNRAVPPKRPRTPQATPPSRSVYCAGGVPVTAQNSMVDPAAVTI